MKNYRIITTQIVKDLLLSQYGGLVVDDYEELESLEPIPYCRYLVIGADPYRKLIKDKIHLGPRGEHYGDFKKMDYLLLKNGAVFKFFDLKYTEVTRWIGKDAYEKYANDNEELRKNYKDGRVATGVAKSGRTWYRLNYKEVDFNSIPFYFLTMDIHDFPKLKSYKIIKDPEMVDKSLDYFTNLPIGSRFGLDYETSGFPFDDPEFYHMGVSIVSEEGFAAYYDMEWMDNESKCLDQFKSKFKIFLDKHHNEIYTYNVGFEMRATYLLFSKLYNFHDSSTINIIEGNNYKRFSLKYTAMNYLKVPSWDDDFDDLLDRMHILFSNSSIEKYESSSYYIDIIGKHPEYKSDFDRLISRYWGYPYKCIPGGILGKYCCLDSFYTVKLRKKSDELGYSSTCWDVFCDNIRLGASLEIFGWFKDSKICNDYSVMAEWFIAYGNVHVVRMMLDTQLKRYKIDSGVDEFDLILKSGLNPLHSKSLLQRYVNEDWESGLNETLMESELGYEFYKFIVDKLKSNGVGKFLRSYLRKRKLYSILDESFKEYWKYEVLDDGTFSIKGVHYSCSFVDSIVYNTKKYQLKTLNELSSKMKLMNYEKSVTLSDGNSMTSGTIIGYCKSIYNSQSPDLSGDLLNTAYVKYREVILYLRSKNYKDKDLVKSIEYSYPNTIEDYSYDDQLRLLYEKYSEVIRNMDPYLYSEYLVHRCLPGYIYKLRHNIYSNDSINSNDRVQFSVLMSHWEFFLNKSHGGWFLKQTGSITILSDSDTDYCYNNIDDFEVTSNTHQGLIKFNYSYLLLRKYSKSHGTYLTGMMSKFDVGASIPDKNLISTERFHSTSESDTITKSYVRYNVCQKKSKRWSAPVHTIPPKDQSKRVITTPDDSLLSYFDISGAEVRTLAYLSKDQFCLDTYDKGLDIYMEAAHIIDPSKPTSYHRENRWLWKIILLGSMYGMGIDTMSQNAGLSYEDAEEKYHQLFSILKGMKSYIEEKSNYCINNGGKVDTVLGDLMDMSNEPPDRWGRLGINQLIQGYSAVALASGFYNIVKVGNESGLNIRPLIVVHDSSINYFPARMIFDIEDFYKKNFTEYLYNKLKIRWDFDIELGANYYDRCNLSKIDDNTVSLKGSYTSISKVLNKLDSNNVDYNLLKLETGKGGEITEDKFNPIVDSSIMEQFYSRGFNPTYYHDRSNFKITLGR